MRRATTLFVFCILHSAFCISGDWPQWRGPLRDGVSTETGLLKAWPASGPPKLWQVAGLGEGFSSFAVAQGRLFTQGQRSNQAFVLALDAATGKKLWETVISTQPYREQRGNGPRGVPTVDGNFVYAESADGTLACLEAATGKLAWKLGFTDAFGGRVPHWGYSESPLIDGSKVIVTPGGPGASVVALDKSSGKVLWKSGSDSAAYSSPIIAVTGGIRQVVQFTFNGVIGLRSSNGEQLWKYSKVANNVANIATPIYQDPYLFVSSDYGTGCALLKLTAQGQAVKAEEVYFSREMKNHYTTSVVSGDHLYGYNSNILTAMNWKTGQVAWRDRAVGKGQVAMAEGRLYLYSEDGVAGLAEVNPAAYKEISRFTVPRGAYNTWTTPVISGGRMYLREQDTLYCYDIKAK